MARDNLRLLAQIIAGLKKHRKLEFDTFARWSAVLEAMTRNQLLVAGAAYVHERDHTTSSPNGGAFWLSFTSAMRGRGFEEAELKLHCAALAVYGLLSADPAWNGLYYEPTSWLRELGLLADLSGVEASQT